MKKLVILINDTTLLKPLLDLAKSLNLSVDDSNYYRTVDEVISIGTSKKYVVAGNNNFDFYKRKYPNINAVRLDKAGYNIASFEKLLESGATVLFQKEYKTH